MKQMNDGEVIIGESLLQAVQEGLLWEFYYENLELPAGPTYFLIRTGSLHLHLTIRLEGTGRIKVDTFSRPTTTANGTQLAAGNYNDDLKVPLKTKMYFGPTVTNEGTPKISKTLFGFSQGNNVLSSSFSPGAERVWKPNDTYLLKITTVDTNPWFRMSIDCYEKSI